MARLKRTSIKGLFLIARLGWGGMSNIWTLLQVGVGLAVAGAPLLLWQYLTQNLFRAQFARLPLGMLLVSLAFAAGLSAGILHRLYRFSLRCRAC